MILQVVVRRGLRLEHGTEELLSQKWVVSEDESARRGVLITPLMRPNSNEVLLAGFVKPQPVIR
jgi:hypothetical protein